jgi:hypothetical protein
MTKYTPRIVSNKILDEVYDACLCMSDDLRVCRAGDLMICDRTGRGIATVKAALRQLESTGRIDRHTWLAAYNVKRRDIRCFPGHYLFKRKLIYCADAREYRLLREIAEFKAPPAERFTPAHD